MRHQSATSVATTKLKCVGNSASALPSLYSTCGLPIEQSRAEPHAYTSLPPFVEVHAAPSRRRSPPRKPDCPNYTAVTLIAHNVPVHTLCKPTQSFFLCFRYPTARNETLLPAISLIVHAVGVMVLSWLVGRVSARMQGFALLPNRTPGRFALLFLLDCS
jgi:hypothetical protein